MSSSYVGDEVAAVDCTASLYDTLPFPTYSRPQCVGDFSVDEHGEVHADARNKSVLWSAVSADKPTKLRRALDLNKGFETWRRYDEEPKLDNFLRWLLLDAQRRRVKDIGAACHQSTVLCYRGLLRTILCTVYDRRTPWQFVARRLCGAAGESVLLLCEFDTERKRADRRGEQQGERQSRMCYWGYKFEHCVTVERDASEPDTSRAVANRSQYCRVYRCTLGGGHRLLFAAEMDCELAADSGTFVELKTQRRPDNEHQERNFHRYKTIKWWSQSFLSGVDTILAGMRNDQGLVDRVKPFPLTALSKAGAQYWKGTACFNFLQCVLKAVDEGLAGDDGPPGLLVSYEPGAGRDYRADSVRICKLDTAALHAQYRFLADEFCSYFGVQ